MKDINAISKNYFGKIKANLGFKTNYAKSFKNGNENYYKEMFDSRLLIHADLINFIKSKNIKTVCEIGCSTGNYPIRYKDVFENISYTGIDISEKSIQHCKMHSKFEFICADFLKMPIDREFDLVFSMGVVDHVYDIDLFISKIVKMAKKHAYVNSYRGYFPTIEKHTMQWVDADGIFYNNLSIKQITKLLLKENLSKDEFVLRPLTRGDVTNHVELVVEINKKR